MNIIKSKLTSGFYSAIFISARFAKTKKEESVLFAATLPKYSVSNLNKPSPVSTASTSTTGAVSLPTNVLANRQP